MVHQPQKLVLRGEKVTVILWIITRLVCHFVALQSRKKRKGETDANVDTKIS